MIEHLDLAAIPSRQELFKRYERRRRAGLVQIIAPIFLVLVFGPGLATIPAIASSFDNLLIGIVVGVATALIGVGLAVAFFLARRDKIEMAATITVLSISLGVITTEIFQLLPYGLEINTILQFQAFSVAIVISGLLGDTWLIIVTTLVMSVFATGLYVYYATLDPAHLSKYTLGLFLAQNLWLAMPTNLIYLGAIAGLTFAFRRSFTRILFDLSDTTQQYERARQLDELKLMFIRNVNHELRNPVMALLGYMEGLQYVAPQDASERFKTYLTEASRVTLSLRNLITSILDVRQFDTQQENQIRLNPVDLYQTLDVAYRMVDPLEANWNDHALTISLPAGVMVLGEPVRIQQIVTNLLSNAAKYSPKGTPITVDVAVLPPQQGDGPGTVEIRVRDYGLGIPPEQAGLLFNRFVRLPRDLMSKTPGNGLGLYLARAYAQSMQGDLTFESSGAVGEGSTFILRLRQSGRLPRKQVASGAIKHPVETMS